MSARRALAVPIDSVTLNRWPGLSGLPSYAVTVYADGRVERNDLPGLDPDGVTDRGHAEPQTVAALFRLFETPFFEGIVQRQAAGVADDDPTGTPFGFGPLRTDIAGATLTVRRGPEALAFEHELGAGFDSEVHVYRLEAAIDRAAGLGRWSDGGATPGISGEARPSPL